MGLTHVDLIVANVANPDQGETVRFMVDSGAIYSVVPADVLSRLGIQPLTDQVFTLANGGQMRRRKGGAVFRYGDRVGVADVVFGEEGDYNLLGAFTLEALGLGLDPLKRTLIPLPMMMA